MSISHEDFNQQCLKFVSECRQIDYLWTLLNEDSSQVDEIMPNNVDVTELANMRLMLVRNELKPVNPGNQVWMYEYNVIYSDSYEVPVMYFSTSRQGKLNKCLLNILKLIDIFNLRITDGSLVNPVEVESFHRADQKSELLGQMVSQVEHPILFRPFHMIHPCRTRDFMKQHSEINSANYLICWLSTIGTVLSLKLDLKLAKLLETR